MYLLINQRLSTNKLHNSVNYLGVLLDENKMALTYRLHYKLCMVTCVPSNFMANRRVPKFSLNNCAQSPKKTFMCPKFCTNPVLMYTKCHISTNLSSFLKLCLLYCQKYLPLLQQIADLLKKKSAWWKY